MEVSIIGYLSFDSSIKIHNSGRYTSTKTDRTGHGGLYGFLRHIDRGTDRKNGCEVQHSNTDIDPEYTLYNESYYKDEDGNWKTAVKSKDMFHAVQRRVDYAKGHGARIAFKGQNDTVIARPLVVQLGEDAITGHESTWMWDVMGIVEDMFGAANITGFSIHRDETSPHIHIIFVPCHEEEKGEKVKCTLSQTKFFKNPGQLAAMHKRLRKSLCDKGYSIEQENKPIEEQLAGYYDKQGQWHQQGLTPDQLKKISDRQIGLKMEEIEMRLRQDEMDRLEKAMRDMQIAAKSQRDALDKDREDLAAQQAELASDRATVAEQMQAIIDEKVAVQAMKQDAEGMLEKAYDTAAVCSQILDDEKKLNQKFLEFLDREGQRTNRPTRRYVEHLYAKFQKERRESLSDWQLEMLQIRAEREQTARPSRVPNIIDTGNISDYSPSL